VDLVQKSILQRGPQGWHPVHNPAAGEELLRILDVVNRLPYRELACTDEDFAVVILAGGTGTRFADGSSQKVLFPVLGVPALERSLVTCQAAGAQTIVLVIGFWWEEVFEFTERRCPGCHFVYQPRPLGTGDAARCATWFLRARGFEGTVLMLAGDKVLSPDAVPTMLEAHRARQSDMTLAIAGKKTWPDSGRVVLSEDQQVLSVIERPDVIQRQMFRRISHLDGEQVDTDQLFHEFRSMQHNEKKLRKALGPELWRRLTAGGYCRRDELISCIDPNLVFFCIRGTDGIESELTPEQLEAQCDLVNVSLYLFSSEALYWAMDRLESLNAQGEFYLTDAAQILAQASDAPRQFRVHAARLPDDYDAAGFNTLEELADIENHMRQLGRS
jgi:bifunctional N-acetylglucosamine-1-phosphate-uridyltransferase/glucosamine-1-phosphate-acetyltransferase GlmU-like protein